MIDGFYETYENWKEDLQHRYLPPNVVASLISENSYVNEIIGNSFENRPIYKLTLGTGKLKLLFWSQMHGNESTATRAMFDVWKLLHLESIKFKHLLEKVEIHFIPQLNPDGAQYYKRLNSASIDINRDFIAMQTPEMQTLKKIVAEENYDFLFNLHDQRTIFHPENRKQPATLSFLAPVVDHTDDIPQNRMIAIQLISHMIQTLRTYLPNQISRFSDEYYPKATGDNFQKLGYPTILIECGHYPNDYKRNKTRKFTFLAIFSALEAISSHQHVEDISYIYKDTPKNAQKALDIIYRDVVIQNKQNESIIDIGIQYDEVLEDGDEISFIAKIEKIGDLSDYFGHDNYHAENRLFKNESNFSPKIGNVANFNLGDWKIKNGKPIDENLKPKNP